MPRFSSRARAVFECACGDHAWSPVDKWAVALVSVEDVPALWARRWQLKFQRGKAYLRYNKKVGRAQTVLYLHREILGAPDDVQGEHRNRNGLDNRRGNLRLADQTRNNGNCIKRSGCSSVFKGVAWDKRARKWVAYINDGGRRVQLGLYADEADAARAYDRRAVEVFGQFARLNLPNEAKYGEGRKPSTGRKRRAPASGEGVAA